MFKSKSKIFLLLILIIVLMTTVLAACSNAVKEPDDDEDYTKPAASITVNNAVDMIYSGLVEGGKVLNTTPSKYVETIYTIYTSAINYTITYKAYYAENTPDSLFYVKIFDNKAYKERAVFYYDSKDLYVSSGGNKNVINDFSSTMMFEVFYTAVTSLDMTENFYGGQIAGLFDRNEDVNLSLLMSVNNIEYIKVGENKDSLEIKDVDLSIVTDVVGASMDLYLNDIGDKFDVLTQKYLGFRLSRLLESRFRYIFADKINVQLENNIAKTTSWKASGTMNDSSMYFFTADMTYDFKTNTIPEGEKFAKAKFNKASLGKNEFEGTIFIPAISDQLFDMEVVTDLNSQNNATNKMTIRIIDAQKKEFIGAYYRDEIMYLDISGLNTWVGGTVDLAAMHFPKVYFENIDLTNLMVAGYNDLLKAVLVLLDKDMGDIEFENEELYSIIMENFTSDAQNNIYYTITEELIQKIRQDDKTVMTMLSELLEIDQTKLESYLGKDFFSDARLVLSYNLDTGKIGITFYKGDELIVQCYLLRKDFTTIVFPADTTMESYAYSKLLLPDVTTLEFEAELRVGNAKQETDLSKFLGALVGDPSGANTVSKLKSNERLKVVGAISESITTNAVGESVINNTISITVTKTAYGIGDPVVTKMFNVYTNLANPNILLIEYYLPIGEYANTQPGGLKYKISKEVLKTAFNELLGEKNIFSESSVFGILEMLLNTKNSNSAVSKENGYVNFSIMVDSKNDPLYDLIGIENTSATIKARVRFVSIDLSSVIPNNYSTVNVMPLTNMTVESIYSENSKWKDKVDVYFDGVKVLMKPNYSEESIRIVTGKAIYDPLANLFGKEITYRVEIINENGTYKIESLLSDKIIIDPTYSADLPIQVAVLYDNGLTGTLKCNITDFDVNNITNAGYNLSGFADIFNTDMTSNLHIGQNSIMQKSFVVYVLVNNRNILSEEYYSQTPVVGKMQIDPYTYALKKLGNSNYNPIVEGIAQNNMEIKFNNVYGEEKYVDGEEEKTRDLTYDLEGVNRFFLTNLNLEWAYDESLITWRGSRGYAYAYFGDTASGNAIKIAIEVSVIAQEVDYVLIDDEEPGKYTIDYLVHDSYALPTQSSENHSVKVYFKGETGKYRIVGNRPTGISNEVYYNNYLPIQLMWEGADNISSEIKVNGTATLFSATNSNRTNAGFTIIDSVGRQSVALQVVVPSRYMSDSEDVSEGVNLVTSYTVDEFGSITYTMANIRISQAKFREGDEAYQSFAINPYDSSAYLPSNIYLWVDKTFDANPIRVVKNYPVKWKTTNKQGVELNILKEKDGKFYLANPVTAARDLVVYGTVGDGNGEIWVVMRITNLASKLQTVTYFTDYQYNTYDPDEGLPLQIYRENTYYINNQITKIRTVYNVAWQTTNMNGEELYIISATQGGRYVINVGAVQKNANLAVYGKATNDLGESFWIMMNIIVSDLNVQSLTYMGLEVGTDDIIVDPYKPYYLPTGFVAVLESGEEIIKRNIMWHINNGIDDEWYPAIYGGGDHSMYGADNKYLFSHEGGIYYARYIIEGGDGIIPQELVLEINVLKRTIVSSLIEIYNDSENMPATGYIDIDYYSADSTKLLNKLNSIKAGSPYNYAGVYFDEAKSEGIFDRFTLAVDWNNALLGQSGYESSIHRLIYMLSNPTPNFEMTLTGTIATGTINEQMLAINFAFSGLEIESISFSRVRKMAEGNSPVLNLTQQNENYQIDFELMYSEIEQSNVLYININKVFALTAPNESNKERYASPYQYIDYLLSSVVLYYKNGNRNNAEPEINYLGITENDFNSRVLGLTQSAGTISLTEIMLNKLSKGSATDAVKVIITAKVDQRITNDIALTAELFYEDSTEVWGEAYPLPKTIEVQYQYSGKVQYDVSTWTVGETSRSILNMDTTESIPVRLIDTLRLAGGSEGSYYNFYYNLPTEKENLHLQVYIPKKNINKTFYNAEGETTLYNITQGVINIANPYLYYKEGSEYGLDEKLIPTTISAIITAQNYSATDINTHYVDWVFIKDVFTESIFRTGINRVLFATATLKCYYDITKRHDLEYVGQTQTIELYLTVQPMDFYGISYQQMPVIEGMDDESRIRLNTITLDPYNDAMHYNGNLNLPTNGLNVYFNDLGENYTFSDVVFRLIDETNRPRDIITAITYDQYGHTLNHSYLTDRGRIKLRMYLPGYAYEEDNYSSGIVIYVVIYRRVVEGVMLESIATNESGQTSLVELPSLYFIDPYNSATYPLPVSAHIKFEESTEFSAQNIVRWEFFDNNLGNWIDLNNTALFYSLASTAYRNIQYGYFYFAEQAYQGGNYLLRGFIRVGEGATGIVGEQSFEVQVIVLNRRLETTYMTTHAFSDPLGGILSDIPKELSQEMFVDYDKYYIGIIDEEYYYSKWSTPILPEISWSRYITDDEIVSIGGFDRDITGFVSHSNANTKYLYSLFSQEVKAEYELLIKALMWDNYFNVDGNPVVNYSTQAADELIAMKQELENDVIFATYNLLKNKLNNSEAEEDRANGLYLVNGLIVSMSEKTGFNPNDYLDRLSVALYQELTTEYASWVANGRKENEKGRSIVIYIEWENIYSQFKGKDAVNSAELSEYQKLKVLKYNKLNDPSSNKFSVSDREYNTKLKAKITNDLVIYINKEIYLRLYDRVTSAERQRMLSILGQTTERADLISNALQSYISFDWKTLSSYGESAFANISAPAMNFEDIYKIDDVMMTQAITEFLFNIYDSSALDETVLAKFVMSYADYYRPYIEEAVAAAWENYRQTIKDQSITEFVSRIVRETVNSIVPTYIDGSGNVQKVVDFDYSNYQSNSGNNATYWEDIYSYKRDNATAHIDVLVGTEEEKWYMLYDAHLILGENAMVALMDGILAAVPSSIIDKYSAAMATYKDKLLEMATADMDLAYGKADQAVNALVVENIADNSAQYAGLHFSANQSFSHMYDTLADQAFDLFLNSYAESSSSYSDIYYKYSNASDGFNFDKRHTLHYYLYASDPLMSTAIRKRAQEVFFYVLQGSTAYDIMYDNAEKVGLTKARIDSYLDVMDVELSMYNNVFTAEEFEIFLKAKYFIQMMNNYSGGESYTSYMSQWYKESLLAVRNNAYQALMAAYEEFDEYNNTDNAIQLNNKKLAANNIRLQAFNLLVEMYRQKGMEKAPFVQEKEQYLDVNIYSFANIIYEELMASESFGYKNYLAVDATTNALRKADAVNYYYDNVASEEERQIIAYERAFSGGDNSIVYDVLLNRYDVDISFAQGLINCYYYSILMVMLDSVELDITINTNVSGTESQYVYYANIIKNMILAGCEDRTSGTLTGIDRPNLLSIYAKEDYLAYIYQEAITQYTQKTNVNKVILGTNYYYYVYDLIYGEHQEELDEILVYLYDAYVVSGNMSNSEGIKYNAFDILRDNMVAKELHNLFAAIAAVEEEISRSNYYDDLSLFTVSGDYNTLLWDVYTQISEGYYSVYNTATLEQQAVIDNVVNKNLFGQESSLEEHLEEIFNIYCDLKVLDAGDIQSYIDAIIHNWESISIASYGNGKDKEIINAMSLEIKQDLFDAYNSVEQGRIDFYTAVCLVAVLSEYKAEINSLDKNLFEREYLLNGDYSGLQTALKCKAVTILQNILGDNGNYIANALINKRIGEHSYDFVISNTDTSEEYVLYEQKIIEKLLKTSSAFFLESIQSGGSLTLYFYYNYIYNEIVLGGGLPNPNIIGKLPLSYYLTFIDGTNSYSDISYQKAFNAMANDREVSLMLFISDNIERVSSSKPLEERKRHVLKLDKTKLESSQESSQIDAVYISNSNKEQSQNNFKKDGVVYKFVQMNITYVDYFDSSEEGNIEDYTEKNKIIIDPLYPVLPTKVKGYATITENDEIRDVGMVNVSYSLEFYENIYEGGSGQFEITLSDSRGNTNTLIIDVVYLDRKVDKIFTTDAFYGGVRVPVYDTSNTTFIGYHNQYNEDSDTNILLINPINDNILDTYNRKFILPSTLGVRFSNGDVAIYNNVVWDVGQLAYSLAEQNVAVRIKSYNVEDAINGLTNEVEFNYSGGGSVKITILNANREIISVKEYENAPSFANWNIKVKTLNQSITSLDYYKGETLERLGLMEGTYIDVPSATLMLNPYDIAYPKTVSINFGDGTTVDIDPAWRLKSGAEGEYKLKDILLGTAQDRMIKAVFSYLGHIIEVRFVTEDIEIEGVDTENGEYIDGGTLYLVVGAGSAYNQLQKNYAYMYYNFSKVLNVPNWQKVPLSFMDVELSRIVTTTPHIYEGDNAIVGVLGWDKTNYPDINFSPNIKFNVIVIEPKLYGYVNEDSLNTYVIHDYISTPYDNNYQKKKDVNEPNTIGDYFVQLGANRELDTYFSIMTEEIIYRIVDKKINFKVAYEMNSTNGRLAFLPAGGRTISFEITLNLTPYLYTAISNVELLKTKTSDQVGYFTWTTVPPNSIDYEPAIHWPLGVTLKSSEMPKAKDTVSGEIISLMWDLSDVNINLATSEGYKVRGWYYDASSTWKSLELTIFIDKLDKKANILNNLGGSYSLSTAYNGKYYKLPININDNSLRFLRNNGEMGYLEPSSYLIEYKLLSESEEQFSATSYPLNAGQYEIRVRISDYNIMGEISFTLTINAVVINGDLIEFEGDGETSNNILTHIYNGKSHPLVVTQGLPTVYIDNWFGSYNEKEALVAVHTAQGYSDTAAKTRAYNDLYGRVTAATRRYLDNEIINIRRETGITDLAMLNAMLFDRLVPNMQITEVVYTITYRNNKDEVLTVPPTDVGDYTVLFEILAVNNNGNYVFNMDRLSRIIKIQKPDVIYNLLSDRITYSGRKQNPLIDNLHDAEGNLPSGVSVTYEYRYIVDGETRYLTNGITNVGSYYCDITIEGGNNYPSMNLADKLVIVQAKEMHIDIDKISMQYLSDVADIEEYVVFSGLVGTDRPRDFGKIITETEVKSYYTLGTYLASIAGFKLSAESAQLYTIYDEGQIFDKDGKSYYRLTLKNASFEGSLYREIDSNGEYVYLDLINIFQNYAIYITTGGEYEIFAEDDAVVIYNDQELQDAISGIAENGSAKLYLAAGQYSAITLNVNAAVSIVGCYDNDRNILTTVNGITVNAGVLTVKIIKFQAISAGSVGLLINNDANSIGIYDCEFDGGKFDYAVGIKTGTHYVDKIYMVNTSIYDYHRGIELINGNLELDQSTFNKNRVSISIESNQSDLRITNSEFSGSDTAILSSNADTIILYNYFELNRTAVKIPLSASDVEILANNTFASTNTKNVERE